MIPELLLLLDNQDGVVTESTSGKIQFNFSQPEEWLAQIWRFERFCQALGLSGNEKDSQGTTHTHHGGWSRQNTELSGSVRGGQEEFDVYPVVRGKFEAHLEKRTSKFQGALHNEMICDCIAVGLCDTSLLENYKWTCNWLLKGSGCSMPIEKEVRKVIQVQTQFMLDTRRESQVVSTGNDLQDRHLPPITHQSPTTWHAPRCGKSSVHGWQQYLSREATWHKCSTNFQAICRSKTVRATHVGEDDIFIRLRKLWWQFVLRTKSSIIG